MAPPDIILHSEDSVFSSQITGVNLLFEPVLMRRSEKRNGCRYASLLLKRTRISCCFPSDTIFLHSPLTLLLGYQLHLPPHILP